ncbi:MAG: PDZ domain-containing protein, partial [Deltaproteobacteria bacterium]|nr:PDZ domain-containing protein [Deltaproteobacteria bacterium]
GTPAGVTADETAKPKAGGRTKKCEPVPNPRIVTIGEKRWKVDSKMLDYYATHIKALDELGWVSKWKAEDGSRKGFKIGGLSCGNDAWLAGLRNGDIVLTVNGTKVGSILEGIAAYAKHRKADVIALEIMRKGEIRFHTYRMQ